MISVVIPVFNQVQLTERCLDSLFRHSRKVSSVFIIDNASSDDTPQALARWAERFHSKGIAFKVQRNRENVGFGRACNQGLRECKTEYVAVLNNDTWLMPDWDEALLAAIIRTGADLVGPFYDEIAFNEAIVIQRSEIVTTKNRNRSRENFVSILMFFKMSSLQKLGFFDERFFVTYEDTDLKYRMDLMNMRYLMVGNCYIWHHSKGTRGANALPNNYEQEGLRLFMEKWGFDPRQQEHTVGAKLKKAWRKRKAKFLWI